MEDDKEFMDWLAKSYYEDYDRELDRVNEIIEEKLSGQYTNCYTQKERDAVDNLAQIDRDKAMKDFEAVCRDKGVLDPFHGKVPERAADIHVVEEEQKKEAIDLQERQTEPDREQEVSEDTSDFNETPIRETSLDDAFNTSSSYTPNELEGEKPENGKSNEKDLGGDLGDNTSDREIGD